MADRSPDYSQAILVHDSRFNLDTLNDKGATATDAAYTQSGPRAGVPLPGGTERMVLESSGSQSGDGELLITTQRAGLPNASNAAYVVRDIGNDDTTAQQYGHDGWQVLTGYEALINSDGSTLNSQMKPHAVTLDDGRVVAICEALTVSKLLNFKRYDPDDTGGTWTTFTHTHTGHSTQNGACLVALPGGDLLCYITAIGGDQIDALRSTDDGENWAVASYRVLPAAVANADIQRIAAAYSGGEVSLLVSHHDGAVFEATQYASYDLGLRFDEVDSAFSATSSDSDEVESPVIIAKGAGGFAVAWADTQGASPVYRATTIGSASSQIAAQTNVTLATGGTADQSSVALFESEIAEIWAAVHDGSGNAGDVSLKRSVDGGVSYSSYAPVFNFVTPSIAELFHYTTAQSGGRLVVLGKFKGSGNSYQNWSTVCLYLGGYSRHTLPAADGSDGFGATDWLSWGTNSDDEPAWLPFAEPSLLAGWALTSSGTNTYSDDAESGNITTTTGTRYYAFEWERTISGVIAEFAVTVNSGGSTVADNVAARLTISDGTSGGAGTYTYIAHIRMSTTGWQLYDVNGATVVGSATSKALTSKIHFRIAMDDANNVRVWTAADGYLRGWAEGVSGSLTNSAAAHGNQFRFGHMASATADTDWYMGTVSRNGVGKYTPSSGVSVAAGWTNPDDLRGRDFTSLPHLVWDGVRLAGYGGPTWRADSWKVTADYDYPIGDALTNVTPSPSEPWRSVADNVEVLLPFDIEPDFTNAQTIGDNFGVFLFNTNISNFVIETYNGSAWATLATAYAYTDFDALDYVTTGRIVGVDTGSSQTGARYFFKMAHAGDTMDFQDGTLRKIETNTPGAWTDSTTVRPEIKIEGADGTEPASGTGRVWRRDFGIVYAAAISTQQIRIRIPAHETADGYYQIGSMIMGPLVLFGKPTDRGWTREVQPNVGLESRRDGVRRAQEYGAMRETIEISWTDGFDDMSALQMDDPVPDWVGNNGTPSASHRGTTRDVLGTVRLLGGALHPCVYLGRVDKLSGASSQAFTMPDSYWYGRIASKSLRVETLYGTESLSEAGRLNTVSFEEEL
jgi:hypothetical protein